MYFELLKEWCDTLIELQITEFKQKEMHGGIMCPSCVRVHGRCADAIYPMMYMADVTGEAKYLDCAKLLFQWAENMARPDGSYINDTNSEWKGITVFSAIQLGEALHYHGHILDDETRSLWRKRFRIASDYLLENIDIIGGNINYPITCSAAMAIAGLVLKEEKYSLKGRELAHKSLLNLTEEGLLFGEGKPQDKITKKGCRPVDLGYNVEESLPGLLTYGLLENDTEVIEAVCRSMEAHLEFMLPDGAWDNSWGTRNNKWSYWGSRTSDGCQAGYGLMAKENPLFAEAAYRNALLLKECTHNGLLHGGLMFHTAGEKPCVHHTFCHAKAIAAMLDHQMEPQHSCQLPREKEQGIRFYPSIHVNLLSKGQWRATVSDYDFEYSEEGHASGGAITALWNMHAGMLLAGTMSRYYLVEPNNMQLPVHTKDICLTPRIEYKKDGTDYRSINDLQAEVICKEENGIQVFVKGTLVDGQQNGEIPYSLKYEMDANVFCIWGKADGGTELRFHIPLISASTESALIDESGCLVVERESTRITLESDHALKLQNSFPKKVPLKLDDDETNDQSIVRVFNPVSGFEAVPVYIDLIADNEFCIKITVEEN